MSRIRVSSSAWMRSSRCSVRCMSWRWYLVSSAIWSGFPPTSDHLGSSTDSTITPGYGSWTDDEEDQGDELHGREPHPLGPLPEFPGKGQSSGVGHIEPGIASTLTVPPLPPADAGRAGTGGGVFTSAVAATRTQDIFGPGVHGARPPRHRLVLGRIRRRDRH
jgi:hypothetical protein